MTSISRDRLQELLRAPVQPEQEFVAGGATFGEVHAMAAALRAALARSAPDGLPVCLATEDRGLTAAALLAALGGGPPLLLPHAFSPQALLQARQLTGFAVAVTDLPDAFPADVTCVLPGSDPEGSSQPARVRDPDAVLLQLFTGGSSGTPQLWRKTAGNLLGESRFLAAHFRVGRADRILATVPPHHIYGLLFSVLLPLVARATVIGGTPAYPAEQLRAARQGGATLLVSIPPHFRGLREKGAASPALRLAFSSAGMLDREDNEAFRQANAVPVIEVYGSTETGGLALRNRALGEERFTAFPCVDWRVEGDRLHVRSPFLSPELPLTGDGFFRTGDRAEPIGERGFILMGRGDAITKVAGKRVDLEEIRSAIRRLRGVSDCLVMARPESGCREHRIIALVETATLSGEQIRLGLADSLEVHALPRLIRTTLRIPVTANGKYDREAILRLLAP